MVKHELGKTTAEAEAVLELDIERFKNLLLEHDRSLSHRLSRGETPSLEEKKRRSRILRQLNRTRRELFRLRKGTLREATKRVTFRVSETDYNHLQTLAQQEGLSVSGYIRRQLFPDTG
ncbi:MAG: plasmid mobilization protein [Syntrophobacteria bacterium]